jgi:hypothetical protein
VAVLRSALPKIFLKIANKSWTVGLPVWLERNEICILCLIWYGFGVG